MPDYCYQQTNDGGHDTASDLNLHPFQSLSASTALSELFAAISCIISQHGHNNTMLHASSLLAMQRY